MTSREWLEQHGLKWLALAEELGDISKHLGNDWPDEWQTLHDQQLFEAIVESETKVRADVDAAIRCIARRRAIPPLSKLERFHLGHRLLLGIEVCGVGIQDCLDYPTLDTEEDRFEALMIHPWPHGMAQRWLAGMKLRLKELRALNEGTPPPDPAAN